LRPSEVLLAQSVHHRSFTWNPFNPWKTDQGFVPEFLIESQENLSRLVQDLAALEKHPKDVALLDNIVGTIHTIKGTYGIPAFPTVERITHQAERLLSQLRDGHRELSSSLVSVILETADAIREVLASIEATGAEGPNRFADLTERLRVAAQSTALVEPPETRSV
jgi:two-component system chemotaxis sensor kinase CheA